MKQLKINLPELPFAIQEAMNRLRINIRFVGEETRNIMITSCLENEGKSTVAINLWRMLAEAGFRTLYVDLDLRNSVIRSRYGMTSDSMQEGLEHYLSGMTPLTDIVYRTNVQNGYIIPCVNKVMNPTNLFETKAFSQLMTALKRDFRYVIIDTPPIVTVSDAVQIAAHCDGAVLVVRSNVVPKKVIASAIGSIADADCPLLGAVLNGVGRPGSGYGRYGYGRYGYGRYGYGRYGYGAYGYGDHAYGEEPPEKGRH